MMNEKDEELGTQHLALSARTPAIRFEGFGGEWEEKILDDVVNLENGFAFKSKYFKAEPTDVIVLTPGNVNIGGGFQHGKGQYYEVEQDVPEKYVFKSGDMFITMTDLTPTAQTLGFPAIVPGDGNTYLHNQRLGKLVGFEGNLEFLFQLLSTPKKQKEVVLTSSGTTVKHTSPSKFLNRFSCFPIKPEQTKIGHYFQQFDTLIAQHQKKHDKLLNLKKSLLEKMFPKANDELRMMNAESSIKDKSSLGTHNSSFNVPEIRFKGFSEAWEEKAFGDSFTNISSNTLSRSELNYKAGLAKNIHYGDVLIKFGEVLDVKKETDLLPFISSNEVVNKLKATALQNGDVVIADAAEDEIVGKCTEVFNIEKQIVFSGLHTIAVRPTLPFSSKYLGYYLNSYSYHDQLLTLMQGTKVLSISKTAIKNTSISFPDSLKEQTQIGNLFKQLDTLINQHQTQLKKLNNIKQACLKKMFV